MGLQLKLNEVKQGIGPDTVSGDGHVNAFGMRFTTYRPNVRLTTCVVNGAVGSYTVRLYRIVGTTPTLVASTVFSIITADTDTPITLNLTAPTAADYYVGFDASHGSLLRSEFIEEEFPFSIEGVISFTVGVQYNNWTNIAYRWYYFYDLKIEYDAYSDSGQVVYGPYSLPAVESFRASAIDWDQSVPDGTTLTVEAGAPGEDWAPCVKGGSVPNLVAGEDLYLRVTMATTNNTVSPALSNLGFWYEGQDDHSTMRLFFTYSGRLRHPQDQLSAEYVASLGNLKNLAGSLTVPSFTKLFDVDDDRIAPFFNPNGPERIEIASVGLSLDVNKVAFVEGRASHENISIGVGLNLAIYDINNNPV